ASDTSLAVAPAQQNKSTIVRLRSFVCIADDAPEKRVNMSSPEQYLSSSEPASDTSLAVAPAQQNKSTIVRLRSFVCIADDAPEKRV
ncbi:hypothetical protein G5693_27795, partial [Escherichia coli]|uniref:hypothetical protein n=1 Tax=Escherichia coli TaxID=562 RepID=UPI0013C8F08A